MANLRQILGAGLQGAGESVSAVLARREAEKERRRIAEMQIEGAAKKEDQDSFNRIMEEVMKNNPLSAAEHVGVRRRNADVASPIAGDISKADTPSKALTDEDITNRYRSTGGRETLDSSNITARGGRLQADPNPGGFGELQRLLTQGGGKRAALKTEAEAPDRTVQEIRPDGSQVTRGVNPRTMGEVPTGLSAEQQGANDLAKFSAGEGSPAMTIVKARVANELERLTRSGAVAREGAVAGARESGQERARLTPAFVDARVDEAKRTYQATTGSKTGAGGQSTESERKAAGQVVPLYSAAAKLLELETKGARLQPGATTVVGNPTASSAMKLLPRQAQYSDDSLTYAQAVQDFITTFGYMRSGVAINKEEIPRFMSIVAANPNDPPALVRKKQQSRDTFIASAQLSMGRSAREGGETLAEAVNSGAIDAALVPTFQFTDEDFKAGFLSRIKALKVK